jgi:hypothetical protein
LKTTRDLGFTWLGCLTTLSDESRCYNTKS